MKTYHICVASGSVRKWLDILAPSAYQAASKVILSGWTILYMTK